MLQVLFLFALSSKIDCTFIVHKVKTQTNEKIFNITATVFNDGTNENVLNITITNYEVVEKLILYLKVNVPRDSYDRKYRNEFMKTTIDVVKLHRGVTGNFLGKLVTECYFKAMNLEPEFPIPKRIVQVTNLKLSDKDIPLLLNARFLINIRGVGKIPRNKTSLFFFSVDLFAEIKR